MSESQKTNIENLLKKQGKTKRELAKRLNIKENSINRTLRNPNLTIKKLGIIAGFLEVDINDLLQKKETVQDSGGEYQKTGTTEASNQMSIIYLSEALNRNSKTIDNLVMIIAENFSQKKD